MEKTFSSLSELQAEIDLLKVRNFEQEEALKEAATPTAIFSSLKSYFISGKNKSITSELLSQDIVSNIARVALPLFMNGVLFKRSGFITKTLVTFISQKLATQVNSNAVSGIMDKVKGLFGHKKTTGTGFSNFGVVTKKKVDYGIPPDSESY